MSILQVAPKPPFDIDLPNQNQIAHAKRQTRHSKLVVCTSPDGKVNIAMHTVAAKVDAYRVTKGQIKPPDDCCCVIL